MKNDILVTIRGAGNTLLEIVLETMHAVGDVLDLSSVIHRVPEGMSYGEFFREYVDFCVGNESCKMYRIDSIEPLQQGYEVKVSPIKAK